MLLNTYFDALTKTLKIKSLIVILTAGLFNIKFKISILNVQNCNFIIKSIKINVFF